MSLVVINHPVLADEREQERARALIHIDALPEHLARGWELVGPCADRYRDPLLTDDEQLLADEARRQVEADVAAQAAAAAEAAQTPDADGVEDSTTTPDGENAGDTTDQE